MPLPTRTSLLRPFSALITLVVSATNAAEISGSIIDAATGEPVAARLTIESADGKTRYLAETAGRPGLASSVPYEKQRGEKSVEIHTALSPDPFRAELPPGKYRLTASRGPEYRPDTVEIEVPTDEKAEIEPVTLTVRRWIDMAQRGWFSGDVHCHLTPDELRTVLPAADLNVTFPLTSWVSDTTHKPTENNKYEGETPRPFLVRVDDTHVFWPVNTEYEIGTHEGERHLLGAIFALHHEAPLGFAVPPVGPMVKAARKQGAILDLDKHSWPWSMMLPAIGAVDLYEVTNNHLWQTEFFFNRWNQEYVPDYMEIPRNEKGEFDEPGWIDFGLQNWYALLNCDLRLAPSAGTASGVHPVPLGFGRVYVRMPDRTFDFDEWLDGLKAGRSFVTTGPMLFLTVNEAHPGSQIAWDPDSDAAQGSEDEGDGVPVIVRVECERPIEKLELVVNGDIVPLEIGGPIGARAAHSAMARTRVKVERSSWIAARVFTKTDEGRPRFAHTAPVRLEVKGKPLRPRSLEANYLVDRVKAEI
ncbi:MAG: CehA/McbA family metallohydrolase, partial [Verrucomicrobiae bacterium]|nr:CehA/McbA family metallohydrolase [Verrucomicrobiae bacterium]